MKTLKLFGLLVLLIVRHASTFGQTATKPLKPGDDFYTYVNAQWIATSKIPDDMSAWGGFETLSLENQKKLKNILEELAKNPNLKPGSSAQKVGDLYASGMDTLTINNLGYKPLLPVFKRIDAVKNYKEFLSLIAQLYKEGNGHLLGFGVEPDQKNSTVNMASFSQSGTFLPEKSYYSRTDAQAVMIRQRYKDYITTMFRLTGTDTASAKAKATAILNLETSIAKSHLSNVEQRDPASNYHKMTVAEFQKITPHIIWQQIFAAIGIHTKAINVAHPQYFKALDSLLVSIPVSIWKDDLKFIYINSKTALLSRPFLDANFAFSRIFTGAPTQPERWKTMVSLSDGELLGQLYVDRYFTPKAKAKMDTLVGNLLAAVKIRLEHLTWMSDTTKTEALLKLSRITRKIGYPEKIKDYSTLAISRSDFFGNSENYGVFAFNESLRKIDQPVDKSQWEMTAPTVNAYYNPLNNEIVFPAGILQPPFFDVDADDASNYGGIGMVISHEITHGFDDQGRQYDANGNLRDWWTPGDARRFGELTKKLITQYNGYKVLDTLHLNGQLTVGENIADLGGIAIAYDAFKLTQQGKSTLLSDGLTPDQKFFKSFATAWRFKARPNLITMLITVDPHSPAQFRVNGPLSNFEHFYQVYQLSETDSLYKKPADRIVIW